MINLTDFLLARIAEDEAVADRTSQYGCSPEWWEVEHPAHAHMAAVVAVWRKPGGELQRENVANSYMPEAADRVVRLGNPARVLAECEAKRRLIEAVVDKDPFDAMGAESAYEILILSHLALPYAGHPDYRDEWRP